VSERLKVNCDLTDCAYFCRRPRDPKSSFCSHPEKKFYLNNVACPLYKAGWQSQDEAKAADLAQRFKKVR